MRLLEQVVNSTLDATAKLVQEQDEDNQSVCSERTQSEDDTDMRQKLMKTLYPKGMPSNDHFRYYRAQATMSAT